jgi:tetratricopeptide (TPR) repeat protein
MSRTRLVLLPLCVALALGALGCDRRKAIDEYNQGVGHAQAGQYPRAIVAFQRALALRPEFPEASNSLGYVFNRLERYDEAIEHFLAAAGVEKYKERHLAYLNLAAAYSNNAEYDEAASALSESIKIEATVDAHYALAQVYAIQEKTDRAIASLREVSGMDAERMDGVATDAMFDRIREEPQFRSFLGEARR